MKEEVVIDENIFRRIFYEGSERDDFLLKNKILPFLISEAKRIPCDELEYFSKFKGIDKIKADATYIKWTSGAESFYEFNDEGLIIKNRRLYDIGEDVVEFSYDPQGRRVHRKSHFNVGPHRTKKNVFYTYDSFGNLERKISDDGKESVYSYNSDNKLICYVSNGLRFEYEYDEAGNCIKEIQPTGMVLNQDYTKQGNIRSRWFTHIEKKSLFGFLSNDPRIKQYDPRPTVFSYEYEGPYLTKIYSNDILILDITCLYF